MERCICSCVAGTGRYNFEIFSFAPSSEILTANMVKEQEEKGNLYSIGLFINIGAYCIMLAGDVENRTFRVIPDHDLEFPIDYIKIPHHGSSSAEILPDRLAGLGIKAPNVAVSTVFRMHHLPERAVLKNMVFGVKRQNCIVPEILRAWIAYVSPGLFRQRLMCSRNAIFRLRHLCMAAQLK